MNHVEAQMMAMDQLRVGQYVHLDLKWFEHPFAFSQFKIKSEEQIKEIRSLGLKVVRINPELSDLATMNPVSASPTPAAQFSAAPSLGAEPAPSPIVLAKQAMLARMRLRRQDTERIEKAFINTAKTIRNIEKNLYSRPLETVQQVTQSTEHGPSRPRTRVAAHQPRRVEGVTNLAEPVSSSGPLAEHARLCRRDRDSRVSCD